MKTSGQMVLLVVFVLAGCSDASPAGPTTDNGDTQEPGPTWPVQNWAVHSPPVFEPSSSGWDGMYVLAPSVVKLGGTFHMWYGGTASDPYHTQASGSIGYATSEDGILWNRVGSEPVLGPRQAEWDHTSVAAPTVLVDGNTFHMWYRNDGFDPVDWGLRVGYATSVDGIQWDRSTAAVMERGPTGEWNSEFVGPGTVIKEDGIFKMWFRADGAGVSGFGYATSTDGVQWTLYNDPATTDPPYEFSDPVLLSGSSLDWDANLVLSHAPAVVRTGDGYELWYAGRPQGVAPQSIGHAASPDGINWTKNPANPVLQAQLDWGEVGAPKVLVDGDRYRMWFQGWAGTSAAIGYAVGAVQ